MRKFILLFSALVLSLSTMLAQDKTISGTVVDENGEAVIGATVRVKGAEGVGTVTDIDGVKLDFPDKWVHLRKSNTEPIIRVYSEASTMEQADELGKKLMQVVYDMQ